MERRRFVMGGLIAIGGLALPRCGPANANLPSGPVAIGPPSQFAAGTWTLDGQYSLIVGHDSRGIFVYSAACTHQGCLIDPPNSSGTSVCPCHGSVFDGSGAVVRGPARSALVHFQASMQSGMIVVDPSVTVSADTRMPV
jgi:nitrite reductase/ring-hydroxylating ferredoxin subunit